MTIIGVGIDILHVHRIKLIYDIYGHVLAKRILTNFEFDNMMQSRNKYRFIAKHFAVKEAIVKACGTGFNEFLLFKYIELRKDKYGKPIIFYYKRTKTYIKKIGVMKTHITITDEYDFVIAFALLDSTKNQVI